MAYSPNALEGMYPCIDEHFRSMRRGGIYARKPGYHNSVNGNSSSNYSVQAPADLRGDRNAARALDATLDSKAEMRLATRRLIDACEPNRKGDYDPRIECLREVIGTLDSRQVMVYNRYGDGRGGSRSRAGRIPGGSDRSHLWHVHLSFFTDYATDDKLALGVAEVMCGLKPGKLTGDKGHGRKNRKRATLPTGRRKVAIRAGAKRGGWFWGTKYISAKKINKVRAKGWGHFNRNIWYVQAALESLGYGDTHDVEPTGFWNGKTQRAYDHFRRTQGWKGSDARGSVGVSSLTALFRESGQRNSKKIRK